MSNLPGNPHEGLAKTWLVAVSGDDADTANQIFAQCASAEATLALAFEQRTANLIAYMQLWVSAQLARVNIDDEVVADLAERLGIELPGGTSE